MVPDELRHARPLERRCAGQRAVQDAPEAVQIRPDVDARAERLLGAEVVRCPEDTAGRRQRVDVVPAQHQAFETPLVGDLEAGRGTAGQMLSDPRLYENMNEAAAELQSLIADVRRDPKRYLSVSFSVF